MEPILWPLSAQNRWTFVCPKGTVTYTFPLNIHHEGISPDAKRHDQSGYRTPVWIVNLNSSSLDGTNWKERDLSSFKQIIGCYKWPECPLAHYHKEWCSPNGSSFKFVMSLWRRLSYLWIEQNTETFFSKVNICLKWGPRWDLGTTEVQRISERNDRQPLGRSRPHPEHQKVFISPWRGRHAGKWNLHIWSEFVHSLF